MRQEINRLLNERGVDVLWVTGATCESPDSYYLTGGVSLTAAWLIVRPDREPLLCYSTMEREAARSTGLPTLDFQELGREELSRKSNDPLEVTCEMFSRLAQRENLSGRLAIHGVADPGDSHYLLEMIGRNLPQFRLIRDIPPVLQTARSTKDSREIARMKEVAADTLAALRETLELMRQAHLEGEQLIGGNGVPLTVGAVKAALRQSFAARGLQETHETILGVGREAGIPHASNPDETVLCAGKTIVLDIFPSRKGGGYFFDITRSFCIGQAPDEALRLYEEVLAAQDKAAAAAAAGVDGCRLQELVCDHFEALGHPTIRSAPGTTAGYVHSLGHGIGLEVHEQPFLRLQDQPDGRNRLQPGSVFTIEPGLYYPERGLGIRIEDVYYIDEQGKAQVLAPFEKFALLVPEG